MKHRCVCCGNITINDPEPLMHEICPVCFWENDPIQNEISDRRGGPNRVSLKEARENYKKYGACEKECIPFVRKPYENEKNSH